MKDSYGEMLFFIQFIVFTFNIVNEVVARVVTCDLSIGHDNSEVMTQQQKENISKNKQKFSINVNRSFLSVVVT